MIKKASLLCLMPQVHHLSICKNPSSSSQRQERPWVAFSVVCLCYGDGGIGDFEEVIIMIFGEPLNVTPAPPKLTVTKTVRPPPD